jgi:hypothetical protein
MSHPKAQSRKEAKSQRNLTFLFASLRLCVKDLFYDNTRHQNETRPRR